MVKELCYRGFEVSKGSYNKRNYISYSIDNRGLEIVRISNRERAISINSDNGDIKSIYISSPQIEVYLDEGDRETNIEQFQQAKEIYDEIVERLDVHKKIKDYVPKFSAESEINLFNLLEIDNISELEKLIEEDKQ